MIREMSTIEGAGSEITRVEYLSSVLVEAGTVERTDVDAILARFDELDVCRSGTLDEADIRMAAMKEFYDTPGIIKKEPSTRSSAARLEAPPTLTNSGHATVNGATRVCGDRPRDLEHAGHATSPRRR